MFHPKQILTSLAAVLIIISSQMTLAGTGQIVIINGDGAGEGLNDPIDGAARLAAFNRAADILNAILDINVNVEVRATFDPLTCSTNSATLGQAGASFGGSISSNSGAIQANISYPIGLFNELMGSEQNSLFGAGAPTHEINAQFNSNLGNANCLAGAGWDYSLTSPEEGKTAFLPVVLHEIIHGLGFSSVISSNGSGNSSGNFSIYDQFLVDDSNNRLVDMNQSSRAAEITGNDLWWNGSSVRSANGDTNARMYAPSPYKSGSSTSHFDTSFSSPEQLMEPEYTTFLDTIGLAKQLLEDLGWPMAAVVANTAPSISAIANQTLAEDSDKNIALSATDSEEDSLNFSIVSATEELNASISGTTLTLDPVLNYNGSGSVTVKVSDGELEDSTSFNVTVTAVNDAPVITAISNKTMNEDGSLNVTLASTDVDGPAATYSLVSAPASLGASVSGSALTLSPAANFFGSGSVTVKVSDGSLEDTTSFNVTVQAVNDAPQIAAVATQYMDEDSSLEITLSSTDVDGPLANYSLVVAAAPLNATIDGNTVTVTPDADFNGTGTITARVTDGSLSDDVFFNVVVRSVNDAPVLQAIGNRSVDEDGTLTITLEGDDADNDELAFSLVNPDMNLGASISGSTLTIAPVADFNGITNLTIQTSDSLLTDSETIQVTVNAVNDRPLMTAIADQAVDEDGELTVSLAATDIDSDNLTFSIGTASTQLGASLSGNLLTLAPVTDYFGQGQVEVQVSDGALIDSTTFTLTVNAVNDAPIFSAISDFSVPQATSRSLTLTATDADNDVLTYSLVNSIAQLNASLSDSQLTISPDADYLGTSSITVRASDGVLTTDSSFSVVVTDNNIAPELTAIADQSLAEDGSLNIALSASDANNDELSFSISEATTELGISLQNNQLTISPQANFNGSGSVRVTVSDGELSDSQVVNITVTAVDDAPQFTPQPDISLLNTGTALISLTATDIDTDNDQLSFAIVSFNDALLNVTINNNQLTLIPVAGSSGISQLVVQVSDGANNVNQTINVSINAPAPTQHPPVFTAIATLTLLQGTEIQVILSATDEDQDNLSFQINNNPTPLQASISSNQLTITAADNTAAASYAITLAVSDGSHSVNQVVTVNVLPAFELQQGDNNLSDGGTSQGELQTIDLQLTGGDNQLSTSVFFNGSDHSSLLQTSETGYQLLMPEAGAFAGSYRIDVSDNSGFSASYYIERPLRVLTNASPLLDQGVNQQVWIEGAPVNTTISLTSNNDALSFSNDQAEAVEQVTSPDNAEQFNRAIAYLEIATDPSQTEVEISAEATNLPGGQTTTDITIARTVSIQVNDSADQGISGALVRSSDASLATWHLEAQAETDNQGQASLILARQTQSLTISAEGYISQTITLNSDQINLVVELQEPESPFTLNGTIDSQGFDFSDELPAVEISMTDGSKQTVSVEIGSISSRASFIWQGDLNLKTPQEVVISHSSASDLTLPVIVSSEQSFVSALLVAIPVAPDEEPITLSGGASGAGGSAVWLLLFVSIVGLYRRKAFTH